MRLLVATRNPGKLAEFRQLLGDLPVVVVPIDELDGAPDVVEDQPTLEGNARKKAETLAACSGLPTLADDTGLEVDALGGRPGVFSARYAGPEEDPAANRRLLLAELAGREDRSARFRAVIAFAEGGSCRLFEGICEGRIAETPRGDGGFGYDPLFVPGGEDLTFAELDPRAKNAISHRGRALRLFSEYLHERIAR
jgi:XTP/dITP diphosphohydrolase